MGNTIKDRLITFLKSKGLSQRKFEQSIGVSNGFVNNISKGIGADKMQRILSVYPDLNVSWLLYGEGTMLADGEQVYFDEDDKGKGHFYFVFPERQKKNKIETKTQGIPYYDDLPVSAGQLDIALHDSQPSGYIDIPGLRAHALFPVVGCSMKPEINPGDIIGVESLNSWDSIDPDKVYMIITSDDRMIKHLEIDDEDKEVLWCVSPNYKRFKIAKSNIKAIYRICYVGKLM